MKTFLVAIALLAVSVAFGLELLAYAMYTLLAVMLVSRLLAQSWIAALRAQRECHTLTAEIGQSVPVMIAVRNDGRLPIPFVLLEDQLPQRALAARPPEIEIAGQPARLAMMRPGREVSMLYQVVCRRRGYYQIGPLVLETGDPFGLHRRWRVATAPHFLLVLPKVIGLEGYSIASRRPIGEVLLAHRLFEDPTRIAGVRRYEPGDPLNRVHWRATARTGRLHAKVYEPSCVAGATIVLEFHRRAFDPRHEPLVSDLSVTAAASIADALARTGQQVGLISNGRDAADRIRTEGWAADPRTRDEARRSAAMSDESDRLRPVIVETRRGAGHVGDILRALARLEYGAGLTLAQLLDEAQSRMPRDATLVPVLPSVTDESAIALGHLRRRGYAVTAILSIHNQLDFADASAPLLAQGVRTLQLTDEDAIPGLCRTLVRGRG